MDLRHLSTFQAIAEAGSFVRAAERLGYAQSSITTQMQQLEQRFGLELFTRHGKGVDLTEAGRVFQEQAARVLERLAMLEHTMDQLASGDGGHVRLGVIEPSASLRLPAILAEFLAQRPQVKIAMEVHNSQTICQRLATGELDLGVCASTSLTPELRIEPLFDEEIGFLVPARHPLASHETLVVAQVVRERMLVSQPGCIYRRLMEDALEARGVVPNSDLAIGSNEGLKRAVQEGLGVAPMPLAAATPVPPGTQLKRLADLDLRLPIGLVRPAETPFVSKACQALADLLVMRLADDGTPQGGAIRTVESA